MLLPVFFPAAVISGSVITGDIMDIYTELPVEGAEIKLPELSLKTISDNKGQFSISISEPGMYRIEFKRLGYLPEERKISIPADTIVYIHFHMIPSDIRSGSVVVSGDRVSPKYLDLTTHNPVKQGEELEKIMSQSIASTLKNEAGFAVESMGPAPARPVIRGLGGSNISIREDGFETADLSATSPDHAISVEHSNAERIDITRGPRLLLNSGTTLGGVVNIINNEIPHVVPVGFKFDSRLGYESANNGVNISGSAILPYDEFAISGDISYKDAGDISSPEKILQNTSMKTSKWNLGASWINSEHIAGISLSEYSSNYGIPGGFVGAHPNGVDIEMFRRSVKFFGSHDLHRWFVDNAVVKVNNSYYKHTEYESNGSIGAQFVIRDIYTELLIRQVADETIREGAFGVSYDLRERKMGGFVFTPPNTSHNIAAFVFEDLSFGDNNLQAGFRYAFRSIIPDYEKPDGKIGHIRQRAFHLLSASLTYYRQLWSGLYFGLNLSRSSRAPTAEELYSEGPHLAAYSYEIGNPSLDAETGYGAESFVNVVSGDVLMSVTGFLYQFPFYIIPQNTGDTNYAQLLPIYGTKGVEARLAGIEAELEFPLLRGFELSAILSYTHGENLTSGMPLPMIPPFKLVSGLSYKFRELTIGIEMQAVSSQERTDEFESRTPGYATASAFTSFNFTIAGTQHLLNLYIHNIFDRKYYNHLSRIKSIMPEPGRSIRLNHRFYL